MDFHWHSLKTRLTLLSLVIFLAGIGSLTAYVGRMLQKDFERMLGEQQFSTASVVAMKIDQDLEFRKRSLERVAGGIPAAVFDRPARLQALLEDRPLLLELFNGGCYAIRADGVAVADVPHSTGRTRMVVGGEGWLVDALAGKTAIGKPAIGKMLKAPVFTIATPIRDAGRGIIGVLAGVVDLSKPNFLNELTRNRYGRTGDYLLNAPRHRLVVTSSDESRVMQPLPAPGVNPSIDRVVDGFEGTLVLVNPVGVEQLASVKRIPAADWYLAVALPTEEAFAPIRSLRRRMLAASIILSVLAGVVTWLMLRRQLSPMFEAMGTLSRRADTGLPPEPLPVATRDEVGQLIGGFNSLLESLGEREALLRASEGELRRQNRLFSSLLKLVPIGVFMVEAPSGKPLLVNDAAADLLGRGILPDATKDNLALVYNAFKAGSGEPYPVEEMPAVLGLGGVASHVDDMVVERPDGTRRLLEVFGAPMTDEQGQVWASLVSFIDITERRRDEDALRESRHLLAEIIEKSPISMAIVGMDGTIERINRRAIETFGYFPEEIPDMAHWWRVAYPDEPYRNEVVAEWTSLVMKAIAEKTEIGRREYRATCKDGTVKTVLIFGIPVADKVFVIFDDITDRKRAEEERLALERQLLQAQKMESLGVLAGGIAHDFNNILTSIVGNTELALLRLDPDSPARDNIDRIEKSAVHASDLARQMLAYSGKGRFVVEPIDINRLVEEMGHMFEVSVSKKAALRFDLSGPLPAVEGDATQVRQVVLNLVINASEAIGDRSGVIAVSTGCRRIERDGRNAAGSDGNLPEGDYVFLEVEDTGCGMDRETRARIFDPFFTTKFTGRGLGMAVVQGIVRGHKGTILVSSEPGKGSRFTVLLPAGPRPAKRAEAAAGRERFRGEGTILLVDDEEGVRVVGTEMLAELGFTVVTADDGREAVERFRTTPGLRCVILDMTMPRMDGEETFRELKALDPDVKVILSSGYSEDEVTQKFAGKGLAGFIRKPYTLSLLREVLEKC